MVVVVAAAALRDSGHGAHGGEWRAPGAAGSAVGPAVTAHWATLESSVRSLSRINTLLQTAHKPPSDSLVLATVARGQPQSGPSQ